MEIEVSISLNLGKIDHFWTIFPLKRAKMSSKSAQKRPFFRVIHASARKRGKWVPVNSLTYSYGNTKKHEKSIVKDR